MSQTMRIKELAHIVRSKNAGPFELTLDVFFKDKESYEKARDSGGLTPAQLAKTYGVDEEKVLFLTFFEPALAFKATLARDIPSGSVGDSDVFGAQSHVPLMEMTIEPNRG